MAPPDGDLGPDLDFYDLVSRCMVKKGESALPMRKDFDTPEKAARTLRVITNAVRDEMLGAIGDVALEEQLEAHFGKTILIKAGLNAKGVVEKRDALAYLGKLMDCLVDHGTPYDKLPDISAIRTSMWAMPEPTINPVTPEPTINPPKSPEMKPSPPAPSPVLASTVNKVAGSIAAVVLGLGLAVVIIALVFRYTPTSSPTPAQTPVQTPAAGSYTLSFNCGGQSQCAADHSGQYTGVVAQGLTYDQCVADQQAGAGGMIAASSAGGVGTTCSP